MQKLFKSSGGTPADWAKLTQGQIANVGSSVEGVMRATASYLDSVNRAEVAPVIAWALFDANYSERGKQLAATARIYTQLEVPWTADTGEIAESDMELRFLDAQKELDASYYKAWGSYAQGGINNIQSLFFKK